MKRRSINIQQRKKVFSILKKLRSKDNKGVRFSELWRTIENQTDFYCSKGQLSKIMKELESQGKIKRIQWTEPSIRCGFLLK